MYLKFSESCLSLCMLPYSFAKLVSLSLSPLFIQCMSKYHLLPFPQRCSTENGEGRGTRFIEDSGYRILDEEGIAIAPENVNDGRNCLVHSICYCSHDIAMRNKKLQIPVRPLHRLGAADTSSLKEDDKH